MDRAGPTGVPAGYPFAVRPASMASILGTVVALDGFGAALSSGSFIALSVGSLAGLLPAIRAARLSPPLPLSAIRHAKARAGRHP
jgi:hypothetical protein